MTVEQASPGPRPADAPDAPDEPRQRKRMSPQQRRRQLLDLGLELAAGQPVESVTIEEVAQRAGVSRALIFHYFESRQDFHRALIGEQAAELLARTEPRTDLDDPVEMLTTAVAAYIDYVADNREGYRSLLRGAAAADPGMREVAERTRAEQTRRILELGSLLNIEVTPTVELAVAGWVTLTEDLMLRWIADPAIDRDQLLALMVGSLPQLAQLAAGLDA